MRKSDTSKQYLALALGLVLWLASISTNAFNLDVDGDGEAAPLTDGLLIIRHLFGFSGSALTNGAVADGAVRSTPSAIADYLAEQQGFLDIDSDGKTQPLTDGLLIIRYLFGFSGNALISGAVADGAGRQSSSDIETFLIAAASGQSTVTDLPALGVAALPVVPDSDFNAHIVALSDHVDGSQKPVFYGLAPNVDGNVLKLDLSPKAIDLSNIQGVFNGTTEGSESAKMLFLLDRVPEAGASGRLTFSIALTDGTDTILDRGERLFQTSFEINWSSDGVAVSFSAPVQDQVVTIKQSGITFKYPFQDVQPRLLEARVPSEFPGYPLALEVQLLGLFNESLISRLKAEGLFEIVANYFDNVSDYYLAVELENTSSSKSAFLSLRGETFETIQGFIKVADVTLASNDRFNLISETPIFTNAASGYVFSLNAEAGTGSSVVQGLFSSLCDARLCFDQLPSGYVRSSFLNEMGNQVGFSLTLGARLDFAPEANQSLTYQVTWTQGSDSERSASESAVTMTVPLDYVANTVDRFFLPQTAASLSRVDDSGCSDLGSCEDDSVLLNSSPVVAASVGTDDALGIHFDVLPAAIASNQFFEAFFEVGEVHLKVELLGDNSLLNYQQQVIESVEGVLTIR